MNERREKLKPFKLNMTMYHGLNAEPVNISIFIFRFVEQ